MRIFFVCLIISVSFMQYIKKNNLLLVDIYYGGERLSRSEAQHWFAESPDWAIWKSRVLKQRPPGFHFCPRKHSLRMEHFSFFKRNAHTEVPEKDVSLFCFSWKLRKERFFLQWCLKNHLKTQGFQYFMFKWDRGRLKPSLKFVVFFFSIIFFTTN